MPVTDLKYITLIEDVDRPYALARIPKPNSEAGAPEFHFISRTYSTYGGKSQALEALRTERDQVYLRLWGKPLSSTSVKRGRKPGSRLRQPTSNNRTGKVGVSVAKNKQGDPSGFTANWTTNAGNNDSKQTTKTFGFGPLCEYSPESAFVAAARERDTQTGAKVLSNKEYLAMFKKECLQ